MKFNNSRRQILKLGQHNSGYTYKLGDKKLVRNPAARAWGVWVDIKLNIGQQCALGFWNSVPQKALIFKVAIIKFHRTVKVNT